MLNRHSLRQQALQDLKSSGLSRGQQMCRIYGFLAACVVTTATRLREAADEQATEAGDEQATAVASLE